MKIVKRRRKENKTDYANRIKLLKSGIPRIVFRKTNKYLLVQYVTSKEAQDKVKLNINSKELLKYGWPEEFKNSLKSIPAAYLIGFLTGITIKKNKLEKPIADFGMLRMLHKTKVYGFLKGLIDAEIDIKCDEKTFPSQESIEGKFLKKDFSKNFEKIKLNISKK